jgi:site-specific recombinase XerD
VTDGNKALLRSFTRSLRNANRSPRTIQSYTESATLLAAFRPGVDFEAMTRDDLEAFMGDYLARHKATSAAVRFRALRRFYNWMVAEEILDASPMAKMSQPQVAEQPVPILTLDELAALLRVTAGKGFEDRRDHAIIRLFVDSGIRLGEMAGLGVADVDLDVHDVVHVVGKGSRGRSVPFGGRTGTALDRYLRERARHKLAKLPNLWIGSRGGPMTESGIAQMLRPVAPRPVRPPAPAPVPAHLRAPVEDSRRRRGLADAAHRLAVTGDARPLWRLRRRRTRH